jgi:hypothetical protein
MNATPCRRRKVAVFWIIYSLILLCLFEIAAAVVIRALTGTNIIYDRKPDLGAYKTYVAVRDEILGWPSKVALHDVNQYDPDGSRPTPSFPYHRGFKSCASLYGDSFTYSTGADDAHAWGNVLSNLLKCRVRNYGVGGYGTDQAYLRFLHNTTDGSRIAVLNHLSENIVRNVNQFRDLIYPGSGLGFKPRFVLEGDGIRLVPIPQISFEDYADFVRHPEKYLTDEYFVPGGRSGIQAPHFPNVLTCARILWQFQVQSKLRGKAWYSDFYEPGHPANGLLLTERILEAFCRTSRERGRVPIVTVIPTGRDLQWFKLHGRWPYQPLLDLASERTVKILNVGEYLIAKLGERDPSLLFADISAHFNSYGYRLVAEAVHAYLLDKGEGELSGSSDAAIPESFPAIQ